MKNWIVSTVLVVIFLVPACSKKQVNSTIPSPPSPAPISRQKVPKPYRVGENWYQPMASAREFKERGVASWYGKDFHGKKTSSGEIYDMYDMTAAHKLLPLGTFVRVKNLQNERVVEVCVNDRGPFVRGRVIDLSYAAAKKLDMVGPGTARVEITALGSRAGAMEPGSDSYIAVNYFSGNFTVQVGAFQNRENAVLLKDTLSKIHSDAHIAVHFDGERTFYRVRVGRYDSLDNVIAAEKSLIENGYTGAFSIAE